MYYYAYWLSNYIRLWLYDTRVRIQSSPASGNPGGCVLFYLWAANASEVLVPAVLPRLG